MQVVHCRLIYDLIGRLVSSFTEFDIQLLLLILKSTVPLLVKFIFFHPSLTASDCGPRLRSDDPTALKEIVLSVQAKANEVSASKSADQNFTLRVRFMLEHIYDLKNNKLKQSDLDVGEAEKLKKLLRNFFSKRGTTVTLSLWPIRSTIFSLVPPLRIYCPPRSNQDYPQV
jgi:nucleolar MIF4G domain-containing protein 1